MACVVDKKNYKIAWNGLIEFHKKIFKNRFVEKSHLKRLDCCPRICTWFSGFKISAMCARVETYYTKIPVFFRCRWPSVRWKESVQCIATVLIVKNIFTCIYKNSVRNSVSPLKYAIQLGTLMYNNSRSIREMKQSTAMYDVIPITSRHLESDRITAYCLRTETPNLFHDRELDVACLQAVFAKWIDIAS